MRDNELSPNEKALRKLYSRYGGYWRFPDMLDFCYLVNPYFNRSAIIKEMQDFFPILVGEYPSGMEVNSQLAAECWNIKAEYVIPGNGAAELIKVLLNNIDGRLGIIRPTFEEYPNCIPSGRLEVYLPNDDMFRYGVDELIRFFGMHPVESLLLINPDNPSGNFIPKEEVHRLAQWCEKSGVRLILDESFVDFSVGYEDNTFIQNGILEAYPHMCVVKSISKSYGVPGLRLGILCSADIQLIASLKTQVSIWNINSIAEFFMQIYPKYRDDYKRACDQFIKTREDFEVELRKIPFLKVMPSQANYFFLEVLPPYKPLSLSTVLLEKFNILVSACMAKKGIDPNRYIRVAVRTHDDNLRLVSALEELASIY